MSNTGIRLFTNNVNYRRQQTREQWIEAAKAIHGDNYSYLLVTEDNWDSRHKPIMIICNKCKYPFETNINHARKVKSSSNTVCICRRPKKISHRRVPIEEINHRIIQKHGDRFILVSYEIERLNDPISVWCISHSKMFRTTTNSLIESKNGCELCPKINQSRAKFKDINLTIQKKIDDLKSTYINRGYSYEKVSDTFIKSKGRKITIICPIHKEFEQDAYKCRWKGCPYCCIREQHNKRIKYTNAEFKYLINEITLEYYDLSKVNFITSRQHVIIICPRHGERTCMPVALIRGGGCALCSATENKWYWDRYQNRPGNALEAAKNLIA